MTARHLLALGSCLAVSALAVTLIACQCLPTDSPESEPRANTSATDPGRFESVPVSLDRRLGAEAEPGLLPSRPRAKALSIQQVAALAEWAEVVIDEFRRPRSVDVIGGYEIVEEEDRVPLESVLDIGFTAVAVGPRVILTSAHALVDRTTLLFASTVEADCDTPPEFASDGSADLALCRTQEPLSLPFFDRVAAGPEIADFDAVTLVGFGCRTRHTPIDGELSRKDDVPVLARPPQAGNHSLLVDACLCGGDSGGPVYTTLGDRRFVVGVNDENGCKGVRLPGCPDSGDCSRFTSTTSLGRFIRDWADGQGSARQHPRLASRTEPFVICGINDGGDSRCGWPRP